MTYPILSYPERVPLSTTLKADSDQIVSVWESASSASTNLYSFVNDGSSNSYVRLLTKIIDDSTTETRTLEFGVENPSTDPLTSQSVQIRMKACWNDGGLGISGSSADIVANIELRLRENTTVRATDPSAPVALSTAPTDIDFPLSAGQIASVGNWDDVRVYAQFTGQVSTAGDELDFEVSDVEIDITP